MDIVLTRRGHFGYQFGSIQVFRVTSNLGRGLEDPFTTRFIFGSVRVVSGSVRIVKLGTKKYVENVGSHLVPVSVWLFRVVRVIQVEFQVFFK